MDIPNDYDVVIDTLQKKHDALWNMTRAQMDSGYGMSLMDDIRFEQMDQLLQAIDMWKGRE
jgi:hypothetical protein